MSYIKVLGSGLVKLTGSYGHNTSTVTAIADNTTIDATGASWIVSNSANQHPDADTSFNEGSGIINKYTFIVFSAGWGLTLKGGTVWGEVPQTSDWAYSYNDSAAIKIEYAAASTIDGWRIDKAWDAIRFSTGADYFTVTDVHLSNVRDDAIENDHVLSGTIRDSLFDGVFSGISLDGDNNINGSTKTITLQNTFIRMESYLYNGDMTHGTPFKTDTSAPGATPDIRITNSVFAIEDPTHLSIARLKLAWENVVESSGNVFLNLSDTPLPSYYPLPPAGFTVLQGQAARDYWEAVKAAWLANHDGVGDVALTPLPALPGQAPAPVPNPTPAPAPAPTPGTIVGTNGADTLLGTSGQDYIVANAGNDYLDGRGGADSLTGGSGNDTYVVDQAGDVIVETAGQGDDTVVAQASYGLAVGVSVEVMTTANGAATTAIDLTGNELGQSLYGNDGANRLNGGAGNDYLVGAGGNDVLIGGAGSDSIAGGIGSDKFIFDSKLDGSIDQILDFNPAQDVFYLDNAIFTKLGSGSLSNPQVISSSWLEDGARARPNDSNDYLIYDKNTGKLSYDADGSGSGAAIVFAQLQAGLDLSATNFYVI